MTPVEAIEIGRDALWTVLVMAGPVLGLALVVGLAVSLFQALTQIQEMTLAFVPKIAVIVLSLILLLPFMLATLTEFTERLADRIVTGG